MPDAGLKILLIRHSLTEGNRQRRYIGATEQPLCPEGIALAQRAAGALPRGVELVYRSPQLRCGQTADILFPKAEKLTLPQLRELDLGGFEGKTHAELCRDPAYLAWVAAEGRRAAPNGEDPAVFATRCREALELIKADMRRRRLPQAAVVTHGGVIMSIMDWLFGGGIYRWQAENCGGYALRLDAGGAAGHEALPPPG